MTDAQPTPSPWTEEKVTSLKAMIAEGRLTCSEMANRLGPEFTRSSVSGKASRLRWQIRNGSHAEPRAKEHWTLEQDAKLTKGAAAGLSGVEIAERIGKDRRAVYRRAATLNLRIAGPPPPKRGGPLVMDSQHQVAVELAAEHSPQHFARFTEGYQGQMGKLPLLELRPRTCRFPIDIPGGGVLFCGDVVMDERNKKLSPYCPSHHRRCYGGGL